jgi:quercetin dioxygenase-like cupin family protein
VISSEAWNWESIESYVDNETVVSRKVPSDGITIKRLNVKLASGAGDHQHPYDQWFHLISGEATVTCDGIPFKLQSGAILKIPAHTTHSARFEAGCVVLEIGIGADP